MSATHGARRSSPGEMQHATRGAAAVLERMTLAEWDALRDGRVTADELREKYLTDGDPGQADLSEWLS